jgi:hypothetical protein
MFPPVFFFLFATRKRMKPKINYSELVENLPSPSTLFLGVRKTV